MPVTDAGRSSTASLFRKASQEFDRVVAQAGREVAHDVLAVWIIEAVVTGLPGRWLQWEAGGVGRHAEGAGFGEWDPLTSETHPSRNARTAATTGRCAVV